ncbi:nitroreductase family protein [Actinoalloteichus spitiensis]|uniref:nitroreductase family protein n=1 Tax=Actinoalloteichus spitiensis TaxID=252394 RepID=UPI000366CFB2|nr:nitroreductase family protein [Actinoalloteichus spitiensis]
MATGHAESDKREHIPPLTEREAAEYTLALLRDPTSVNPDGWQVDWDTAPWPVKVHVGGSRRPLGVRRPLDRLLFYGLAVSRVRFDLTAPVPTTPHGPVLPRRSPRVTTRRPVPSGGAMYPTEVYVLETGPRPGAHHYDPYRHELVDLGQPAPAGVLRAALGLGAGAALPQLVLVLAHRFWKNLHKYADFATRLGAVDVGVVLGRVIRLGLVEFGVVDVRADLDGAVLAGGLGLDPCAEAPHLLVGLGAPRQAAAPEPRGVRTPWPPQVVERSSRFRRSSRFEAFQAALAAYPCPKPGAAFRSALPGPPAPDTWEGPSPGPVVALPTPASNVPMAGDVLLRRTSSGARFSGGSCTPAGLASVLDQASAAVAQLRHVGDGALGHEVALYCAVHRVRGVQPGWYRACGAGLIPVGRGVDPDCAQLVQEALLIDSLNVELAAFTVHVAVPPDFRSSDRGPRAHRERQISVGVVIEAVTLVATALGLGSHPVLGVDTRRLDAGYGLTGGSVSVHGQVSVGAVHPGVNWEVTVVPR